MTDRLPSPSAHVRHYVRSDDSVPRLFDAYYRTADTPSASAVFEYAEELALAAHDAMSTAMGAWLATDAHYLGCTVHINVAGTIGVADQTAIVGVAGELSGDSEPDYVAAVIRRYANGGGPSFRGRVFIPMVAEINTDTSRLTTDGIAALSGIRDAMDDNITTPGGDLGDSVIWEAAHWSRKAGTLIPVLKWIAEDVLVTQRRRRLRPLQ